MPAGWGVSNISDSGIYDVVNGKVKWIFFDGNARTVSYVATPPDSQTGEVCFAGIINFDGGIDQPVDGDRCNCGYGDSGCDSDVDLTDYRTFSACMRGPGANVPPGCELFDRNTNGSVDLSDFGLLQTAFSPPDAP